MQINNTSVEPKWFIVFGKSQHLGIDFEPFRFNTSTIFQKDNDRFEISYQNFYIKPVGSMNVKFMNKIILILAHHLHWGYILNLKNTRIISSKIVQISKSYNNRVKIHVYYSHVHQYLINFSLFLSIPFYYFLTSFFSLSLSLSLSLSSFLSLFLLLNLPSLLITYQPPPPLQLVALLCSYPLSSLSTENR